MLNFNHGADDPLDSRQLNALVSLAKTSSFAETARELFVTRSTISHTISALEETVGCRLLNKLDKKITLTEAGEALVFHAERALSAMQQARLQLRDLNKWGFGRLRLGVQTGFCQQFLARVM